MNIKFNIIELNSGSHLEQALYKGLTPAQKKWAKNQVKTFSISELIPYGFIRQEALKRDNK